MSVVKINAITVPKERHDELEARFAARAGAVSGSPGFEAFELLRPADDRDVFLVYTRWRSEEDFQAWMSSAAFGEGHRQHGAQGPVGNQSELWSFDVVQHEDAPRRVAARRRGDAPRLPQVLGVRGHRRQRDRRGDRVRGVALAARRPCRGRWVWWATIGAEAAMMLQVLGGTILVAAGNYKPVRFHMFYGFVAFLTVGLAYQYRRPCAAGSRCSMASSASSSWGSASAR